MDIIISIAIALFVAWATLWILEKVEKDSMSGKKTILTKALKRIRKRSWEDDD